MKNEKAGTVVLLAITVLLAFGCQTKPAVDILQQQEKCRAECGGCCQPDGTCVEAGSSNDTACGLGGAACVDCGDRACDQATGLCVAPGTYCDATCNNCCLPGGLCSQTASLSDPDNCGTKGQMCQVCFFRHGCEEGVCGGLRPELDYLVYGISVEVEATRSNGTSWDQDMTALPDLQVCVTSKEGVNCSLSFSCPDTTSCTLDEAFLGTLPGSTLRDGTAVIEVRDFDDPGQETIGGTTFSIKDQGVIETLPPFGRVKSVKIKVL